VDEMTNELTIAQDNNDGLWQLKINTFDEAVAFAEKVAKSILCPDAYKNKPGDVLICMQWGAELKLPPLQALQNIAVVNGKACVYGDALVAVCRRSPDWEYMKEEYNAIDNSYTCIAKRRNEPEYVATFSEADAKTAKLWGKGGGWQNYPKRMLQWRARGFALRDAYPDLLRGMITKEEAEDYPKKDYSNSKPTVFEKIKEAQVVVDTITEDEAMKLVDKINEAKADMTALCLHYKIENLELLPKNLLAKVNAQLDKKIAKQKEEDKINLENANATITPEEFFAGAE
jgi:hypothetical protein